MSIVSVIMGVILIGAFLIAEMSNMLLTSEMVMVMLFCAPIWFYKKKDAKVWNAYLFMMTLMVIARYISSAIVVAHADTVTLPISVETKLIRQFVGIGSMAVWFIWYALVFASTLITNHSILKNCKTVEDVKKNRSVTINGNFFTVTGVVFIINLIAAVFVYSMQEEITRVFINICIVLVTIGAYKWYSQKLVIERLAEMMEEVTAVKKESGKDSKCTVITIKEPDNKCEESDEKETSGGEE